MAKISGLSWTTLSVDDSGGSARDIRSDVTNMEFATPRGTQDVTGIDKAAYERLLLLADFTITLNGVFDAGSNLAHSVFRTVSSSDVTRTVSLAIASQTLAVECIFNDYALSRSDSGEFTWSAPGMLCNGSTPTWGP